MLIIIELWRGTEHWAALGGSDLELDGGRKVRGALRRRVVVGTVGAWTVHCLTREEKERAEEDEEEEEGRETGERGRFACKKEDGG